MANRNSPQKHVWRAKVVLAAADGHGTAAIGRRAGLSRPSVRRWRERFAREGVAGLLRDKSRKPGKAPLPPATVDRVVGLTLGEPPGEATHWTGRMMAKAVGISLRSVQRIWKAHRLAPHRVRTFKLSSARRPCLSTDRTLLLSTPTAIPAPTQQRSGHGSVHHS